MDRWLIRSALSVQAQGKAAVHVAEEASGRVAGYFALAPHEPHQISLPRQIRGSERFGRVPGLLLGKIALRSEHRGQGFGAILVLEALRVACAAAELIGGRMIVVDARSARVAQFYRDLSFLDAGGLTPLKLYMRVATANNLIADYDAQQVG